MARRLMNYFAHPTVAERYTSGRPFFHPLAIQQIRASCSNGVPTDRALDVACGTGQSTLALLEVVDEIVGMDNAAEMLSRAVRHPRIRYLEAAAEHIPLSDASFGLVTVALAFHWFDQQRFMAEARRVLRPDGWLVIYNDGFTGRMNGNESFETWNREHYLARYPTPPRNNRPLTASDALAHGFTLTGEDEFVHQVEFTPDQLADYLLTQTNVISAVELGREDLRSVGRRLTKSVQPLFSRTAETFLFSCQIRFLKRT